MELDQLIPANPEFTLKSTGKTYVLRVPNLEDRVALVRICGGEDEMQKVFAEKRWPEICKMVYRLMADKSDFLASEETAPDDDGVMQKVFVSGPLKLMRAVGPQSELIAIMGALTAAFMAGEPLMKDYVEGEVKKKMAELASLTGENSSTSSVTSTDTPPISSEALPSAS